MAIKKADKPKKSRAPMCRLCKTNHWAREGHRWPNVTPINKPKKDD